MFEFLSPNTVPFATEKRTSKQIECSQSVTKHGEFVPLEFSSGGSESREGIKSTIRQCCSYEPSERPEITPIIARLKNMFEACEDDDDMDGVDLSPGRPRKNRFLTLSHEVKFLFLNLQLTCFLQQPL
eukprot:TRINITY_DN6588_c0_g1_i1.p2 TRINITY_DN6588_c0_g1~~TRINITY_DN6588_c0_g1_i1.p2  ORF type:complete len:150 (+),score=32.42 TRINITY_DN6588_c0_g1_i1:69-452(+)